MQISDKLGQYSRNVANGTEELRSAQGTQKMVSSVSEMSAGSIFEGTVNQIKGGKVALALGNGQVILARLEGKVDIQPGTSMFFQVRANDGATVSIRPYAGVGNTGNPILLNALTAAQVPVSERTLAMVDAMMQEQLPVNRESVLQMAKLIANYPEANVQTVVQMTKLGLPVTESSAAQFDQYLSNRHAILGEMELAAGQIVEALAGEEGTAPAESFALYEKLMDIFLPNEKDPAALPQETAAGQETAAAQAAAGQEAAMTLESVLTPQQLETLERTLQNIPTLTGNTELFPEEKTGEVFVDTMQEDAPAAEGQPSGQESGGRMAEVSARLDPNMPVEDFLQTIRRALSENSQYGFSGVVRLFAGKEFQALLKGAIERQWLLQPRELLEEKRIDKLYEAMERQMQQTEAALQATGSAHASFSQTAADVRGNIEFMNQMNQICGYIQMPLKLAGQKANGELYVYRNGRRAYEPGEELTAFLHLDLQNLGSTDVSVRMKDRQVKTNFYLEDDAAYDLIEKHLPILERRLKNKGYYCTVTVTHEKKDISFRENFMRRGHVSSGGSLHRYSFDVRA